MKAAFVTLGVRRAPFIAVLPQWTVAPARALPASVTVSYWDGNAFVPVTNQRITWASVSNEPTTITFDPIRSGRIRLDLTSRTPNTANGFLQIAELEATGS